MRGAVWSGVAELITLPFGDATITASTPARVHRVVVPALPPPRAPAELIDAALSAPSAGPPLEARVRAGDRVTIIISDGTRDEPRATFLTALRERLPSVTLTIAIATGTHGRAGGRAGGLAALGLDPRAHADALVVDHDGHDPRDLVDVGVTRRGTPVRVHRAAVEADLVIATGVIRPHYFAGFGAGGKAIFPGLAEAHAARINHRWKADPAARPGAIDDNPCRADLDEAAALVGGQQFLLDGVADGHGRFRAAVAGDLPATFAAGVERARPWVTVRAPRSRCIVVGDREPVTASLYQASKCVAAVAPLLADGGTIVLVAPCREGVGPLDIVNHGIYEIGLAPRLPRGHRIVLVSALPRDVVDASYARWSPDLAAAIADADELLVVPDASKLVLHALP
jgi:nickel-dependent lactate racemase